MEKVSLKGSKGTIEFDSPYLMNKNTLAFRSCNLENLRGGIGDMILNESFKGIEIKYSKKRFIVKMDEKMFKEAMDFKNKEYKSFKDYYNRLSNGSEEVVCYLTTDDIYVRTVSAWNKGFAPYWDKMFRFVVEKATGGVIKDNDDEMQFQTDVYDILKLNIGRHDINIINDGGDKYFRVNFRTFITYLME